jgi:hypothetical protein
MITPTKAASLISLIALCAGCARESTPAQEVSPPPTPAVVDAGPQAPKGQSDYQIVMDALNGTKGAPAGAPQEAVEWSAVTGHELQVQKMGCVTEVGVPVHCHMVVREDQDAPGTFLPDRKMIIIETSSGKYSLTIVSAQVPDQAIVCFGLHRLDNNPQVIKGTCGVSNAPDSVPLHNFAAKLERLQSGKVRVHFAYRHKDFDSPDDPVHNGDGHATEL